MSDHTSACVKPGRASALYVHVALDAGGAAGPGKPWPPPTGRRSGVPSAPTVLQPSAHGDAAVGAAVELGKFSAPTRQRSRPPRLHRLRSLFELAYRHGSTTTATWPCSPWSWAAAWVPPVVATRSAAMTMSSRAMESNPLHQAPPGSTIPGTRRARSSVRPVWPNTSARTAAWPCSRSLAAVSRATWERCGSPGEARSSAARWALVA